MANTKISALTGATTPLAGTEVLPVVQSSATKQVSVANLTAGRAVSAASLSLTTTPLGVSSGGTGVSSLTAGYIPYGAGTSAFGSSANLFWNTSTNTLQIPYIGVNTTFQSGYYAAINGDVWVGNSGGVQIGSIKNNGGWFDFQGSSNVNGAQISTASNLPVRVVINGTETWRFDTSQNITQQVAAKGINFTANSAAAGMTSQLLNWYEEGTWTPTDQSGAGLTFTVTNNKYTRTGRLVQVNALIEWPSTASGSNVTLGGLPFTCGNYALGQIVGFFGVSGCVTIPAGGTLFYFRDLTGNLLQNLTFSTKTVAVSVCYMV